MSKHRLGLYGYCAKHPDHGGTHNAGAALLKQGRLVAAVEEERLSRIKMDAHYPVRAIDWVRQFGDSESTPVAVARLSRLAMVQDVWRNMRYWARHSENSRQRRHFISAMLSFTLNGIAEQITGKAALPTALRQRTRHNIRHHHAHAAGGYYCCPWPDEAVLVITLDGSGDADCGTVWIGQQGRLQQQLAVPSPHSIGGVYTAFTRHLGFQPTRHEGKVLGLAAYGRAEPFSERLATHISLQGDYPVFDTLLAQLAYQRFAPAIAARMADGLSREDVAAGLQATTEQTVLHFVRHWIAKTGVNRLALAGGVFANVKLNQRIMQLDEVDNIYIFPNMGDGGLAAGAAMAADAYEHGSLSPQLLSSVYLGQDITSDDAAIALKQAQLEFQRPDNLAEVAAKLLADGRVVARAAGRMEYGPRALGNRTLFASCSDATINQWLNERLQRTEFMPFAPIIMEEHAADYFPDWRPEHVAARFMTITYDASDLAKQSIPAAIHVDGTARPQVLRQQDNPEVYAILAAYHAITGVPALINTSFNMHEEPIVCSAHDAIRAFQLGHIDALICANHLTLAKA
ncbi:MAG: carbamoyltransferase C-terminal domain-containing protein [Mariprofundales bacterium]|nr:carbamoyltransferase C-terminal domain-containing protein [Mariprofundales bacterium]